MTVAFSSSSPVASVALFEGHQRIADDAREAKNRASEALLEMLDQLLSQAGRTLAETGLFVCDIGPGSFTGVKVCVTLAKSMAFAQGVKVAGVSAFDLIAPERAASIPSKNGEFFVRPAPGVQPMKSPLPSGVGYGPAFEEQTFPLAKNAFNAILEPIAPELLVPMYIAEPSISKPKDPKLLGGPNA